MSKRPTHREFRLILASASPRRAELLREHGYEFEVIVSPLPEPTEFPAPMSPSQKAEYLSHFKATAVADLISQRGVAATEPVWILGADTIAARGDEVFGKPADLIDAGRILSSLAGTVHQVITGITLMNAATRESITRHDSTAVHMRELLDEELEAYLATGAWEGKAGAYGIQDHGDAFVSRIEGSFSNVVGLPLEMLASMLRDCQNR